MLLLELPLDVLQRLGEHIVGEVEVAGLRGPSVIAREVAQLSLVSRGFSPVVSRAWATLSKTVPAILCLTDVSDILQECGCQHFLGNEPQYGPVNKRNFEAPVPRKHSPGLQGLDVLGKYKLRQLLNCPAGSLALHAHSTGGLEAARAPPSVKLIVTIEKCQQFFWGPSPNWANLDNNGTRRLESIDMVRELLSDRLDRGLAHDVELTGLLENHVRCWPYEMLV
ncbi:hypothetical protein WJX74_000560 [Apatococcus lobatus]|uniref:F-box domain-containing protein n=1 Tax=Apatococcus lobatus TaxID=904363 RepID=A0AAW1R2L8_9CHLO